MVLYALLSVLLVLIAGVNFVHTGKTAQAKDWSPRRTQLYFAVDVMFAILVAVAITAIWVIKLKGF